jgi:hypothetical protein
VALDIFFLFVQIAIRKPIHYIFLLAIVRMVHYLSREGPATQSSCERQMSNSFSVCVAVVVRGVVAQWGLDALDIHPHLALRLKKWFMYNNRLDL